MRPIDDRTDRAYSRALLCVEYRVPRPEGFRLPGYQVLLAMRYGVVASSASHHLLLNSGDGDEPRILHAMSSLPNAIERHIRTRLVRRLACLDAPVVATLAFEVVLGYLRGYRRMLPLDRCLQSATKSFERAHRTDIGKGCPLWDQYRARRLFGSASEQSTHYALCFFERLQHGLEEVPEIALIGE